MPIISIADTRRSTWATPNGPGSFVPQGEQLRIGPKLNPSRWRSEITYAARLFVGFNVGSKTVHTIDDLVGVVREKRQEQKRNQAASFVAQRGLYTSTKDGTVVDESGAQIVIIDTEGLSLEDFEREMTELAEVIALKLEQEEVIVELQKNGVTQATIGVGPP